jgi:hypothetical protein
LKKKLLGNTFWAASLFTKFGYWFRVGYCNAMGLQRFRASLRNEEDTAGTLLSTA